MSRHRLLELERTCGHLILGGFASADLPGDFSVALARGRRAGAILFRRNLPSATAAHALCVAIASAAPGTPPLIGIDQEGGRVARLGDPVVRLPPMRRLAQTRDAWLLENAALLVARQLRALGFNLDFAPVLDVDSNPENPVIGDRSFGSTPQAVMAAARPFLRGLLRAGMPPCAKHFPGHGDTSIDSHVALPTVSRSASSLHRLEIEPFRRLLSLPCWMSAHVFYPSLDPVSPATLSATILTGIARRQLRFKGIMFSDDLEMGAVRGLASIEELAVAAVRAGCDVLLVCSDWALQERALEALVRQAEREEAFRVRCQVAAERSQALRCRWPPNAATTSRVAADLRAQPVASQVIARLEPLLQSGSSPPNGSSI